VKILFVGETWKGSSARSLREGLELIPGLSIDEVGEDHYSSRYHGKVLRGIDRLLRRWQISALEKDIVTKLNSFKPDLLIFYKGASIGARFLRALKRHDVRIVNVFPDLSPHAHGQTLREAMGLYDLVISTKPFHPARWQSIYGYGNSCVFVPHGYDPAVHYWVDAPPSQDFDLVLAATWRAEYHELMLNLAIALDGMPIRIALSGNGWQQQKSKFPDNWQFDEACVGRAYGTWLRRGKIVIAPVTTQVVIDGVRQPGDEDTTRSYELAAAGCFFLHRRTPYIQTVYDEKSEVPMWDNSKELAELIQQYLPLESTRHAMAAKAHARAVPAYSIPSRAKDVLAIVQRHFELERSLP
jgi:spore maturation protein CgeB